MKSQPPPVTEPVAKVRTIDLRDLCGPDDLYASKSKVEEIKEPLVMVSSATESRPPTEDQQPEIDYQSKLLQSTTDDRNDKPKELEATPDEIRHSRDSVDPFTVSMRETAKLEIENLNTQ